MALRVVVPSWKQKKNNPTCKNIPEKSVHNLCETLVQQRRQIDSAQLACNYASHMLRSHACVEAAHANCGFVYSLKMRRRKGRVGEKEKDNVWGVEARRRLVVGEYAFLECIRTQLTYP